MQPKKAMEQTQLHASCVALNQRALLILGKSGCGKSTLALELMAFGARLISDDRVDLRRKGQQVFASPPPAIAGKIEARGLGLLSANYVPSAILGMVIDLSKCEEKRLPFPQKIQLLSLDFPLFYRPQGEGVAAKILQRLKMVDDLALQA